MARRTKIGWLALRRSAAPPSKSGSPSVQQSSSRQKRRLVARKALSLSLLLSFPLEKPHFLTLDYTFGYNSFEITHEFCKLRLGVPVRHRN
jgi:hypothetical protein